MSSKNLFDFHDRSVPSSRKRILFMKADDEMKETEVKKGKKFSDAGFEEINVLRKLRSYVS